MSTIELSEEMADALWAAASEPLGFGYQIRADRWTFLDAHGAPHDLSAEEARALVDSGLVEFDRDAATATFSPYRASAAGAERLASGQ